MRLTTTKQTQSSMRARGVLSTTRMGSTLNGVRGRQNGGIHATISRAGALSLGLAGAKPAQFHHYKPCTGDLHFARATVGEVIGMTIIGMVPGKIICPSLATATIFS